MKMVLLVSACALLLAGPTLGVDLAGPGVDVMVGGSPVHHGTPTPPNPHVPDRLRWQGHVQDQAYDLDIQVEMDSDPYISYGITAQNFSGGNQTFTFVFSTPVLPVYYDSAFASISASVTDGAAGDGVVVTPVAVKMQVSTASLGANPAVNLGVDVGAGGSVGPGLPFQSYLLAPDSKSNTFAPTVFDTLILTLSFTMTDGGDTATINGAVNLTPEPAALALLGLGACVVLRRRVARK